MKYIREDTLLLALKAARIRLELAPRRALSTGEKYWSWSVSFLAEGGGLSGGASTKKEALGYIRRVLFQQINENRYNDARRQLEGELEGQLRDSVNAKLAKKFPRYFR